MTLQNPSVCSINSFLNYWSKSIFFKWGISNRVVYFRIKCQWISSIAFVHIHRIFQDVVADFMSDWKNYHKFWENFVHRMDNGELVFLSVDLLVNSSGLWVKSQMHFGKYLKTTLIWSMGQKAKPESIIASTKHHAFSILFDHFVYGF